MADITKLQRAYSKSRVYRRIMIAAVDIEIPVDGYIRLFNSVFKETAERQTEAEIKYKLLSFIKSGALEPEDRAEAIQLLTLSQTTLTPAQREYIINALSEEDG